MHTKFLGPRALKALIGSILFASLTGWTGTVLPSTARAETLIVQGSTTFNRQFMEAQQAALEAATGHVLTVIPNRSLPGILALMEGRAQLAMISASLEGEVQVLRKAFPGLAFDQLRAHPIMSTRVAIAVTPQTRCAMPI